MEYVIISFGIVIFGTIIFIAKTYNWLIRQYHKVSYFRGMTPPIIEKAYRAVDVQSVISYTSMSDYDRMPFSHYTQNFGNTVVRDAEHKQYLIKDAAREIADKMLSSGLIQIDEREDRYGPNPFLKQIRLKVKAYKPD